MRSTQSNWVDLGIARIAMLGDPLLHPAAAGIVAGEGENVGAAVFLDELAELGRAQLHVVALVAQQPLLVIRGAVLRGGVAACRRRDLHQAHGARARNGLAD